MRKPTPPMKKLERKEKAMAAEASGNRPRLTNKRLSSRKVRASRCMGVNRMARCRVSIGGWEKNTFETPSKCTRFRKNRGFSRNREKCRQKKYRPSALDEQTR